MKRVFHELTAQAAEQDSREIGYEEGSLPTLNSVILLSSALSVVILLTIIGIFRFVKSSSRSLDKLVQSSRALGGGNLSHRVGQLPGEEFSEIASGLDRMAVLLENDWEELLRSNRNLEEKVEERTAAILKVNQQLMESCKR